MIGLRNERSRSKTLFNSIQISKLAAQALNFLKYLIFMLPLDISSSFPSLPIPFKTFFAYCIKTTLFCRDSSELNICTSCSQSFSSELKTLNFELNSIKIYSSIIKIFAFRCVFWFYFGSYRIRPNIRFAQI